MYTYSASQGLGVVVWGGVSISVTNSKDYVELMVTDI